MSNILNNHYLIKVLVQINKIIKNRILIYISKWKMKFNSINIAVVKINQILEITINNQ